MSHYSISREERVRTTIDIPQQLWEKVKAAIKNREFKSQNAFIIQALEMYLKQLEEAWIDEEFTRMKSDEIYKAVNFQIVEELSHSDWEAFQSNEKKS
jgi:metal-responsive CopG/Arc/MetJ family transcriptional regulator